MQLTTFLRDLRLRIDPEVTSLGSWPRLKNRQGRPVTQDEIAECIGVSRQWYALLERRAVRTSPMLLDRIAEALMLTAEERVSLFSVALPELKLDAAAAAPPSPLYASMLGPGREIEHVVDTLARLREDYLLTGETNDLQARPRILKSWNRCLKMGVDPNLKLAPYCGDLADRLTANEKLLRAAQPIMSYLADQFADTGFILFLADADGKLLSTAGDLHLRRQFSRNDFEAGVDISEAVYGTNAVGTAIVDRRPMQLLASEHFCEGPSKFSCTAAPIYIPGEPELAGAINLTASYKLARPQLLGAMMHSALEIEERLASL